MLGVVAVLATVVGAAPEHAIAQSKRVCLERAHFGRTSTCTRWATLPAARLSSPTPDTTITRPRPDTSGTTTPDTSRTTTPDTSTRPPRDDGGRPPTSTDDGDRWSVPAVLGGAAALAIIGGMLSGEAGADEAEPVDEDRDLDAEERAYTQFLLESGPQIPSSFNMSAFAMRGIVKAGWPLVVEFVQDVEGPVDLRVSAKGVSTYTWHLGAERTGRRHVVLVLPPEFGDALKPALVAVTATREAARSQTMRPFRVLQLGVGPRAVPALELGRRAWPRARAMHVRHSPRIVRASRRLDALMMVTSHTLASTPAIGDFLFAPPSIHARREETSAYRFVAQADFDSLAVEFVKLERSPDGLSHRIVNEHFIDDGVRREQWIGERERRSWDGRDRERAISHGEHKLQVRAWNVDGDWTLAWSEALLTVMD